MNVFEVLGGFIDFFWHEFLFRPLYNVLIILYTLLGRQMGLAIIALVVLIRVIVLPFTFRQGKSEKRMIALQPELEALAKRYNHDLEKQKKETKRLLAKNKIGVWSSMTSVFLQLLVLTVLYSIFANAILIDNTKELYDVAENMLRQYHIGSLHVNYSFFGLFSLILPNIYASAAAALIVLLHQGLRPSRGMAGELTALEKWMIFALPVFTFVVTIVLPSSKAVFVGASVLISIMISLVRLVLYRIRKPKDQKPH